MEILEEQNNDVLVSGTERVKMILLSQKMTNIQFAQATGISMASLSHLLSGRSNPTIQIYDKIRAAFPDLNPTWLAFGIGEMYLPNATGVDMSQAVSDANHVDYPHEGVNSDNLSVMQNDDPSGANPATPRAYGSGASAQGDMFAAFDVAAIPTKPVSTGSLTGQYGRPQSTPRPQNPQSLQTSQALHALEIDMVKEVVKETVKETITALKRPIRKIIEVRIFFDDGTYESFGGPK